MISRLLTATLLGAALLVVASFLHVISVAYLIGITSGFSLAMVLMVRTSKCN